jgi:hypothetical protein
MAAALSSGHLSPSSGRLHATPPLNRAGQRSGLSAARAELHRSALCVGIEPVVLTLTLKDFNDDLREFGVDALQTAFA